MVIETNSKRKYKWWRILLTGFITYVAGIIVLVFTGNPNLFPSVVILGNFLIPITYVSFFYERRHFSKVNMYSTSMSFFYGGFLGTLFAGVLEPIFIHSIDFRTAATVGLIEEFAKIIAVLFVLRRKQYNLTIDGLILGASAGMGFAALESTGYAFTTFMRSGGSLSLTVYITLLRGILSPLGHGTWTAIIIGTLIRERGPQKVRVNIKVWMSYFTVVILHALWDAIPSLFEFFTTSSTAVIIGEALVGFIGLFILIRLWRAAKRQLYSLIT